MNCEICGKKIIGKPNLVKIGGAFLYACDECAKRSKGSLQASKIIGAAKKPVTENKKIERKTTSKSIENELKLKPVENFVKILKEAREKQGLSMLQLSMTVGLKESTLKKVESGKLIPSIESIRKLEKALKVTLLEEDKETLNTETPVPKPKNTNLTLGEVLEMRRRKEENESGT